MRAPSSRSSPILHFRSDPNNLITLHYTTLCFALLCFHTLKTSINTATYFDPSGSAALMAVVTRSGRGGGGSTFSSTFFSYRIFVSAMFTLLFFATASVLFSSHPPHLSPDSVSLLLCQCTFQLYVFYDSLDLQFGIDIVCS